VSDWDERVDLVRRQIQPAQMQLRDRVEAAEREANPQLFLGQQPVDDISNVLLRHDEPPSGLARSKVIAPPPFPTESSKDPAGYALPQFVA
jgi:hypothetical protein